MKTKRMVAATVASAIALTGVTSVAGAEETQKGYQCVANGTTYTNPLVWSAPVVGIISIYAAIPENIRAQYGLPTSQNVRDIIGQALPQVDKQQVEKFVTNGTIAAFSIFSFVIGALASAPGYYQNCVTDIKTPETGDNSETEWDSSKWRGSSEE